MRVQCYVYDITNGMARAMSRLLIGKQVDIIPHTGIVFGGKEYFFGGGICASPNPGNCIPLRPCETLELGNTTKTPQELEAWLQTQHQTWSQDTYNLLSHNCNHFANAVAKFLGVTEVPGRIVNIAEEALSTPQGAQIRQLIESFDRQMQQSSGGLNPFGNVQASAPEPVVNTLELEESLKDIAKEPTEVQRACLTTLIKLATNANTHRGEPLYQKVKMENPTFLKKVGGCAGGTEAMLAIGFVPDTHETIDYWVMQPDHHPKLSANIERMEKLLAKLPTAPAPAPAPAPAARAAPAAPAANSPFPGMQGGGLPGGMDPAALAGNPQMQQMMNNPQMMAQAQQMMQQNPQLMAQAQQLMNDPAAMQRLMQQFNQSGGRPPF